MDEILRRRRVLELLTAIESDLVERGRWLEAPPPAHKLASTMPFCVDTLSADEWLQFVFVPKLRAMVDGGAILPSKAGLAPYAEVAYRDNLREVAGLLGLLRDMDAVLADVSRH